MKKTARKTVKKPAKKPVKKKVDVEGILNTLASIRQQIPFLKDVPPKMPANETAFMGSFAPGDEEAMEQAMEIYYAAEELAKDPAHAHLIPYVEQMREIYRRDFGKDIPPKK